MNVLNKKNILNKKNVKQKHTSSTMLKVFSYALAILFLSQSAIVLSHGYTEKPKTRQQFCVDDGGYWWPDDGSGVPNEACRAAFLESGTFQFVQNIEFSANVADYNNMDAVRSIVKDGSLCAAGDQAKRGMDVPSPHWQRTNVTPDENGEFEYLFFGATPHNPSFWEFYLSNENFDASTQVLTWADLQLIDQKGDIPITHINGRNFYQMKVKIPAGRTGDAILYTRWQREDVAGEGFYNCSDITIEGSTTPPFDWFDKGYYVKQGTEAQAGDEVWFRVFDSVGTEVVFKKLAITADNQAQQVWASAIANDVNAANAAHVQIGVKTTSNTIEYNANDTLINKVWLKKQANSFALDIKKPQNNLPPQVSLDPAYQVNAGGSISITVAANDPEADPLTYVWQIPAPLTATGTDQPSVTIQANNPAQSVDYPISVEVSDGLNTVTASSTLRVLAETNGCQTTDPDAVNHPAWDASVTYQQGTTASHQQLVWKANWWNSGSEPSVPNDAWQLISQVELGWQAGVAYNAGDEVDHNGRRWKAKWWTRSEPGVGSEWEDIGVANCIQS